MNGLGASYLRALPVAFTLMTRFGRARTVDDALLAHVVPWFAPLGLFLGCIFTAPLYLLHTFAPAHSTASPFFPWLCAWIYMALELWSTRALHHDGLADVGDAWGSGATGEKFWHILRDSRLGAFGAMALIMGMGGTALGVAEHVQAQTWWPLILAPAFGRALCSIFLCCVSPYEEHSLGGKVCLGKSPFRALLGALWAVGLCMPFGFTNTCITLILSVVFLLTLGRLARRQGGCNGDFLGTSIIGGQIIFLLTI